MRFLMVFLVFCFTQGCVKSTAVEPQELFPLEAQAKKLGYSYNSFMPWDADSKTDNKTDSTQNNANSEHNDENPLYFTNKAAQSYAFLILDEAIRHDDHEAILEAANAMLNANPNSKALGDAVTWLLSNGRIKEARALAEQGVKNLPDDLVMNIIYAEILLIEKEDSVLALKILNEYVARNPQDYVAQMELALFYLKINQTQKAYDLFAKLPKNEKTPMVLYYTGFALKKLKKFQEAKKIFRVALQEAPDFTEVILELARIEEYEKNYSTARKYYEQILKLDIGNHDIVLRLMGLYLKEGNPEKALNLARQFGDSFSFVVAASAMLMDEGRVDLAEILLERISDMENAPKELPFIQGSMAYEGSKNYPKALKFLAKVKPSDKHYKNSLEMKIQIYLEQDDFKNAFHVMKQGQEAFPQESDFYVVEYQLHLYLEQFKEALPIMEIVLVANPEDYDTAFRYAYVHDRVGEHKQSMKLMEKLLEQDPENYDVLNFIGYMLADKNKDLKRALELLKKADQLQPNSDYITDSLAWAYYRKQDYNKAWELIQKAIRFSPQGNSKDPAMWDHYGDIAHALGLKKEARTAWGKALSLKDDEKIKQKMNNMSSKDEK